MLRNYRATLWVLSATASIACSSRLTLVRSDLSQSALFVTAANAPVGTAGGVGVGLQLIFNGQAVAGVPVTFNASGCALSAAELVTDANGLAQSQVTCQQARQSLVSATVLIEGQSLAFPTTVAVNFYAPADGNSAVGLGMPLNALATAPAPGGRIEATYTGTVYFSSSDPNAVVPPDYTFSAADHGCKVLTDAIQLQTPGRQTITVTDRQTAAVLRQDAFEVISSQVVALRVSLPTTAQAGQAVGLTVAALDSVGTVNPFYLGTVHFSSSDANATLPANVVFTTADAGSVSLPNAVVLRGAGTQTVSAVDSSASVAGQGATTVVAGGANALHLQVPTAIVAGTPQSVTVEVTDAYGNIATGYAGTVQFSTTDIDALVPPDYVFTAADAGVHTWTNQLVLRTSGNQSVRVTDSVNGSLATQALTVVTPVSATRLMVACNPNTTAGQAMDVTVSAVNALGQVATNYNGTVTLYSSDPQGTYGARYTFETNDNGVHVFANGVTLRTAGSITVQATDAANLSGTASVQVLAAAATSLSLTGIPATTVAGTGMDVTVTALDPYDNPATGYTGTVKFTSSDASAVLPAEFTFDAANSGVVQVATPVVLETAATQTVTAADIATSSIASSTASCAVTPASPNVLIITSTPPATVNPNQTFCMGITCKDVYGNTVTSYNGTVAYSSSDTNATLAPPHTFISGNNGTYVACVFEMHTVGLQSLTAQDTNNAALRVTQTPIYVAHACTTYGTSLNPGLSNSRNGTSYNPSMVLDANNYPVISWTDYSPGTGQIFLRRWNGTTWVELTGSGSASGISANGNSNDGSSVALDASGNPMVAWQASGGGSASAIFAMDYSGSVWSGIGPNGAAGSGLTGTSAYGQVDASLALGSNGNVLVSYAASPGGASDAHVLQFGAGAWAPLAGNGNVSQMPGFVSSPSLAVAATGTPFLTWQANSAGNANHEIFVATFNGSAWGGLGGSASGGGISNDAGDSIQPAIALTPAGNPVVAWNDNTSGNQEIYVRSWNGSAWVELASSGSGGGISNTSTPSTNPAVAINASGALAVSWQDAPAASGGKNRIFLRVYSGSTWAELYGSASNVGTNLGADNSNGYTAQRLQLDTLGNPIFVWQSDFGNSYNEYQIHACVWQ